MGKGIYGFGGAAPPAGSGAGVSQDLKFRVWGLVFDLQGVKFLVLSFGLRVDGGFVSIEVWVHSVHIYPIH